MTETPSHSAEGKSPRKISIDVYRGMVMFLMLVEVLHLPRLARHFSDNRWLEWLRFHTSHVAWEGCSLHDLIQPGFTFLVGVAMPFSIAARKQQGNTAGMLMHAAWRAVVLILIGIVLRSLNDEQTNFTFEDTLTQIGLGYFFVFLIALMPRWVHYLSAVMILCLVWLAFALSPAPPDDFDYREVGVSQRWTHHHEGLASRWNKNSNLAWQADVWFLNQFPREKPFRYNGGGYATLSFVPTMVTMLIGLIAGVWLREPLQRKERMLRFASGTIFCLLAGWLLAYSDLCPLVKRIWTPSFTLWSGGWCLLWLAALHWVCDIKGHQRWAFPFMVIGANSILIYVMSWTVERPIRDMLFRHFGETPFAIFGTAYVTQVSGAATLAIMFSVLLWLYRRKVFIRI